MPFRLPLLFGLLILLAVTTALFWPPFEEKPEVLKLYGHIELREIDLAFNVSGRIEAMLFWEGQRVEKGQLLARLEPEPYRAQVERLKHLIEQQEALVRKLERGSRRQEIELARARLQALRAELKAAEKHFQDTFLYAPAGGVIRERILEPGEIASPRRPVYTLALREPLWALVYATARQLGKLKLGMYAEVVTDSFPEKRYSGWIGYISPTAEFTPRMVQVEEIRPDLVYQVRVFVCDPKEELKLGMPVTVVVPLEGQRGKISCRRLLESHSP